jgi:hypothetical protein
MKQMMFVRHYVESMRVAGIRRPAAGAQVY